MPKTLQLFSIIALSLIPFFGKAQVLTNEAHDKKIESLNDREKVDYIIANSYVLYSADYDHAFQLMQRGIEISRKNSWKDKEAYCFMFQGVIYFLKGDYQKVLVPLLKSHSIFDSLQHYDGLARVNNEIGVFYRRQSDVENAMKYLNLGEQYALKANNKLELGTNYEHRAVILEREGKIKEAFDLYKKVYAIRLEQKDSVGLGYALLNLSSMSLRDGDLAGALDFIRQSTVIREKIGDEQGLAVNLVNTGETYFSVKDYKNAALYFEKCLEQAIRIGYNDLARYTYDQLAITHANLNNYRKAFLFQQKGQAFKDSLYSIEKASIIADLQTKYETEKKEQQIALQNAQLSEQQSEIERTYTIIFALCLIVGLIVIILLLIRARYKRKQELIRRENEISVREAFIDATIRSQENERKRFARDLHDGMGQLISSLRLMLSQVNKNTPMEERVSVVSRSENILNDMHTEIRSIAFNLMPQTLIQQGLVPALKEMAVRVNQSGKIQITVSEFDIPERLGEVQEISLYRIIQEWVNNIMKYADAEKIEVQLVGHPDEISVTIEDNGNGFDTNQLEKGEGNGWKNIKSRMNLMKGEVEIDSKPGRQGTTMMLRFPLITSVLQESAHTNTQPHG